MRYQLKQDKPRPLNQCGAMVAPGQDARWRGFGLAGSKITRGHWGHRGGFIDGIARLDLQRKRGV